MKYIKLHKSLWSSIYKRDTLLALFILVIPFFIYIHLAFSSKSNSLAVFGVAVNHQFQSNEMFVWFILQDVVPVLLFTTWFFASSQKWKYILFSLIYIFLSP